MILEQFLSDPMFLLRIDEDLRKRANKAVEMYFEENESPYAAHNQVRSIIEILTGGGISELRDLAHKQANKQTNDKSKQFWAFIEVLIKDGKAAAPLMEDVRPFIEEIFEELKTGTETKANIRQLRQNLWDNIAPTYFEHFVCHYFYFRKLREKES